MSEEQADSSPAARVAASGPGSVAVDSNEGIVATGDHARIVQVRATPFPPPAQVSPGKPIVGLPRPPTTVFVGRGAAYDRLAEALTTRTGVVVTQAVYGLGGVGKSELALQYARRRHERYSAVWWITADNPEHCATGLAALARRLVPGAAGAGTTDDAAAWAIEWLRAHPGWLLVLDNVTDPTHIEHLLGSIEGGHVLITSRRDVRWPGDTTSLSLEVLIPQAAADLIARITGRDTREDRAAIEEIAAELGFLPLALDQAAAYIRQTRIAPGRYLERLRRQPGHLYETAASGDKAQATIARLWDITIGTLTETVPEAVHVLRVLAWYAPDDIPRFMLGGEDLADTIDEILGVLASHSMITLTDETVSVHRLTQAVLLPQPTTRTEEWSDQDDQACETALKWLIRAMPLDPQRQVTGWPTWQALTAHVDAITAHDLPARLHEAAESALQGTAAFLIAQGAYERAATMLETAVELGKNRLGPDHPGIAMRLGDLALAYRSLGRYSDALSLGTLALRITRDDLGPDHLQTAFRMENIAVTYKFLDRHSDALPLLHAALSIAEKALPPDHPNLAISLDNLATCYADVGRSADALPLHERALAIAENALGPDHFTVSTCLNNFANTYGSLDRYADALPLQERALAITEKTLGPDHPDMVQRLINLAATYYVLGRTADALAAAKRAEERALNNLGVRHPTTRFVRAARKGLIDDLMARAMPE